jgi:hypothetical protein
MDTIASGVPMLAKGLELAWNTPKFIFGVGIAALFIDACVLVVAHLCAINKIVGGKILTRHDLLQFFLGMGELAVHPILAMRNELTHGRLEEGIHDPVSHLPNKNYHDEFRK